MMIILAACSGNSDNGGPGRFGQNGDQAPDTTSVEAMEVKRADIAQQIRSFGTIEARDVVTISPQVSNRVTKIYVDLGDTVQTGDIMAKIYDKPFRDQLQGDIAQMRQARASMQRDSMEFARQKKLYERELISPSEFETARSNYESSRASFESARASLQQTRENLDNTEVRAPVYGVVVSRQVAEGDLASSGQTLFELANLVGYESRLYLPMEEWEQATIGQEVVFRLSKSQSEVIARGRISRISPRLDPETGLGEVVISLTEKTRQIHQGMLVEARINVKEHNNSVVIPRSALIENVQTVIEPESNTIELTREYSIFVAEGDTVARNREVTLGLEQGDRVEVLEGLEAGEQLIITGQKSISDGAPVRIAGSQPYTKPEQKLEMAADSL